MTGRVPAARRGAGDRTAWSLAVVLAALALGAYLVGAGRSYGYDESVTVGAFVRTPSLLDPFRRQIVFNNHPLFSFLDHLVWSAGSGSEAALRALPALFGAGTVGLTAWWLARRWGLVPAAAGAAVLAANPLFADASRSVRGYSLLALCAVASTLALLRIVEGDDRRSLGVVYVLASAAGVAVHFYMGIALVAQIAYVAARGRVSGRWRARWYASFLLGSLAYLAILDDMARAARGRGRVFHPAFPVDAAWAVLGGDLVPVAALGALVVAAAWAAGRRRTVVLPAAAVLALLAAVWLVLRPLDLYPRFLVWLVPGVAACVAWVVSRRRSALVPALIGVVAMVAMEMPGWRADDRALPRAAAIVDAARDRGDTPCAVGGEALLAYTEPPFEVQRGPVDGCDLIVDILGGDLLGDRAAPFPNVERLGEGGIEVLRPARSLPG